MVIAFQQGRDRPQVLKRLLIKRPYRIAHRMVMGIDHIITVVHMPGQMQLADALGRQAADKRPGIKPVVTRADIYVVHVQQQLAPGEMGQAIEEFPLGELISLGAHIAGDVFQHQWALQYILHLAHAASHVVRLSSV